MLFHPLCLLDGCAVWFKESSKIFLFGQRYRVEDTKKGDDVKTKEGIVADVLNNVYRIIMKNTASKKPLNVLDKDNVTFSKAFNII